MTTHNPCRECLLCPDAHTAERVVWCNPGRSAHQMDTPHACQAFTRQLETPPDQDEHLALLLRIDASEVSARRETKAREAARTRLETLPHAALVELALALESDLAAAQDAAYNTDRVADFWQSAAEHPGEIGITRQGNTVLLTDPARDPNTRDMFDEAHAA